MYAIRSYYEKMKTGDLVSEVKTKAQMWLDGNYDQKTKEQIQNLIDHDEKELIESFYRDLEFGTRITSYNVCYTKLLRQMIVFRHKRRIEKFRKQYKIGLVVAHRIDKIFHLFHNRNNFV